MASRTISRCALLFLMRQTIMLFYIIVVSVFIVALHGQICNAQPPYSCDSIVNYTEGSKFENNLNTVFHNLVQGTSQSGFNTCVYGESPDQIYGLLQCNGDATTQQCSSCSQNATTTIKQLCGNAIGGKIWLEVCYLRYENGNFFGQPDNSGRYSYNPQVIPSPHVPYVFNAGLQRLFNNLSGEATSGSGYASGTTVDSLHLNIYGLVQCRRDMSIDYCTLCLSNTIHVMITNFAGRRGGEGLTGSCRVRYETYSFFDPATPSTSPAEAPANPITNSPPKQNTPANSPLRQITPCSGSTQIKQYSKASNKMPIILGAAGVLLLLLVVCLFSCWRRFQCAIFRRPHEGHWQVEEDTLSEDRQIIYKWETLVAATNNFHDDNKLGEGGFGPVYKGTTEDGKEIAVKKLSLESAQGKKEFVNEVKLVAKIQHRNLVKLLGCCTEGSERLLVYEYLPNKSLDKFLFNADKRKELDWKQRYNIILGVARGLLYLHQDSRLRIVHRDIKASNILLDEKLNPKITDFGLARLFPDDETHLSTGAAGTLGYMAPEYALGGQLSVKADVYSFGVVLLELMTGRKNTDYNLPSDMEMLLGWAWSSFKGGNIVQTIDPIIIETWDEEQALRCIHVGLLCTQADSSLRPTMSTVSLMLSTLSVTLPAPAKPAYVTSGLTDASCVSPSQFPLTPLSNADASITILVPR